MTFYNLYSLLQDEKRNRKEYDNIRSFIFIFMYLLLSITIIN